MDGICHILIYHYIFLTKVKPHVKCHDGVHHIADHRDGVDHTGLHLAVAAAVVAAAAGASVVLLAFYPSQGVAVAEDPI